MDRTISYGQQSGRSHFERSAACLLGDPRFSTITRVSRRHRLGRCDDAPWYRYPFSDSDFAVEARHPTPSNFDPRHRV